MRLKLLVALPIVIAGIGVALSMTRPSAYRQPRPEALLSTTPTCHDAQLSVTAQNPDTAPGLSQGLGDAGFGAERARPDAAAYFDEGVELFHAFNAPEAIRALRWAERQDPTCAMCYWAEAWARGPTINYPVGPDQAALARRAALHAAALGTTLSPPNRALIAAIVRRYPAAGGIDNHAYANAVDALAHRYPANDPIAVEAAAALLIASGEAWHDLSARPPNGDVRRARELLDTVLRRSPDFTPAIHYDIHLSEWLGEPRRALPGAERLGRLAPMAGHLVHMPSHLYYRLGRYQDAAMANARAVVADTRFVTAHRSPGGLAAFALHAHNVAFGLASALMSGDAAGAMAFARAAQATYGEGVVGPDGYLAWARYGEPVAVLDLPKPRSPRAEALWHYARGEANARRNDAVGVAAEAQAIAALQTGSGLGADMPVQVARLTLEGRAAMLDRDPAAAAAAFRRAADLRDAADANPDPPAWPLPPRRSLAAALLAAGDVRGAEREARHSLKLDVADPLALHVLAEAQRRVGNQQAKQTELAAIRAWHGDRDLWRLDLI